MAEEKPPALIVRTLCGNRFCEQGTEHQGKPTRKVMDVPFDKFIDNNQMACSQLCLARLIAAIGRKQFDYLRRVRQGVRQNWIFMDDANLRIDLAGRPPYDDWLS